MSINEIICQICRNNIEEPINFCTDIHEESCKDCILSYIDNSITSSHLGSCPCITCPSITHSTAGIHKKRKILPYEEWKKYTTPEISKRYTELANSILLFLCGGCHAQKSLDVGYELDIINGESHLYLQKYLSSDEKKLLFDDLKTDITSYASGLFTVEEFFNEITKTYVPNLLTLSDQASWEIFIHILKLIIDPERRANLHLRYLREHPRITTLCCSRVHCFRCKVKDYHEGKTCLENTLSLDHSIVSCPNCNIALAKGDGCNTVTCVCGNQFSWSVEKENSDRCQQFLNLYPDNTSIECANILCTYSTTTQEHQNNTHIALINQAKAWQIRNRVDVSRALLVWYKNKYWTCPSQCCVVLPLQMMPEGIKEAVTLWKSNHTKEVEKCMFQTKFASESIFTSLYPFESQRSLAANQLMNESRRMKCFNLMKFNNHFVRTEKELLIKSANEWIQNNPSLYSKGLQEYEIRSAKQFLYLYGNRALYTVKPACIHCPSAIEWSRESSNQDLTYTNENTTVERVGSVSCYPAAFSNLVADHCMFQIRIISAPRTSNWLTFGIARKGMQVSSSDGVGRTIDSWGVADDRSSNSSTIVAGSGASVENTRKLSEGDILTAIIDTNGGWCQISINDDEYIYKFDIPIGTMDDYCFAMTFANDHRVSILSDDWNKNRKHQVNTTTPSGELNLEQSYMFNNFKKQLKLLLLENNSSKNSNVSNEYGTSPLKVDPQLWIHECNNDNNLASSNFELIRTQILKFVTTSREFPWINKESCLIPSLTWNKILYASSWYHENRIAIQEAHDAELAYNFYLTHIDDAPFIAAVNLAEIYSHKVNRLEQEASLAFMRFYSEEMQQWYEYDYESKEPVLENVAKKCRCLPRHMKSCPLAHNS